MRTKVFIVIKRQKLHKVCVLLRCIKINNEDNQHLNKVYGQTYYRGSHLVHSSLSKGCNRSLASLTGSIRLVKSRFDEVPFVKTGLHFKKLKNTCSCKYFVITCRHQSFIALYTGDEIIELSHSMLNSTSPISKLIF